MNLNWSKAPEGAEAGHPGADELYPAWYRKDVSGLVEQICPDAGIHTWTWMGGRKDFPVGSVLRPPILLAHAESISAASAGFEILTKHSGLASSIKNACAKRLDIEVFGYHFSVLEVNHESSGPCNAKLSQVKFPPSPAWNGEGRPPAGTECEVDGSSGPEGRGKCVIRYSSADVIVYKRDDYDFESFSCTESANSFRPVRTAEQIAAEAKLEAAKELYCAINWNDGAEQWERLSVARKGDYLKAIEGGWGRVLRA